MAITAFPIIFVPGVCELALWIFTVLEMVDHLLGVATARHHKIFFAMNTIDVFIAKCSIRFVSNLFAIEVGFHDVDKNPMGIHVGLHIFVCGIYHHLIAMLALKSFMACNQTSLPSIAHVEKLLNLPLSPFLLGVVPHVEKKQVLKRRLGRQK